MPRRTRAVLLYAWLAFSMPAALVASSPVIQASEAPERYIVLLEGEAAVFQPPMAFERASVADTEDSGTRVASTNSGERATAPGPGDNRRRVAPVAQLRALSAEQDRWLAQAQAALGRELHPRFRYFRSINGLALDLEPREAMILGALDGVRSLERERLLEIQTDLSPTDTGADRVWEGTGGTGGNTGYRGEGVIIGFLDGGIDPEHPAFAAVQEDGFRHVNPFGAGTFLGHCDPVSPNYDARLACNDKLVGMWSWPESGDDPRDESGHGTHVAAIAAGNPVSDVEAEGGVGSFLASVSGIAPRATIIAYDVCAGGCPSSVVLAAIEQAVEDGVDLLNFSISLPRESPWRFSVSRAFLGAEAAGIIVVKSGGNGGPGEASADPAAPWILSVGAASHGRRVHATLEGLQGGADSPPPDLAGRAGGMGFGPGPIVATEGLRHAAGGVDDGRCTAPFEAESLRRSIVLCDRADAGAPVDQPATAVVAAGASAIILADLQPDMPLPGRLPSGLPSLHLDFESAQRLRAWLASGTGHAGRLSEARSRRDATLAGRLWPESGRGPALVHECCRREGLALDERLMNWPAPDLLAPGVAVLSAMAGAGGEARYLSRDGTSMAAPHASGALALLRERWPGAGPSELRSMLMLHGAAGAWSEKDGPATVLDGGAGRLDIDAAMRSGLTLEASVEEMGAADPALGGEPSEINQAALVDMHCIDRCGWSRNIGMLDPQRGPTTYRLRFESEDAGLVLVPELETLTVGAGGARLDVEADVGRLEVGETATGFLRLEPVDAEVPAARLAVVVRRAAARLPGTWVIRSDRREGAERLGPLSAPEFETLEARVRGLTRADEHRARLPADPTRHEPFDGITGTHLVWMDVAPPTERGADRVVAEVVAAEAPDVDLYLGLDADGDGLAEREELRCASARAGWVELCEVDGPEAGRWWALAQVWAGSGGGQDLVELRSAVVVEEDAGNFEVSAPTGWPAGQPFEIEGRWRLPALRAGDRWYGSALLERDGSTGQGIGRLRIDLLGEEAGSGLPTSTATSTASTTSTATATAIPTAIPTELPSATASPAATPVVECVCAVARRRVPATELNEALHQPERFGGWDEPVNNNKPPGIFNPRKRCLSIRNASAAYHPLFNGMVFKSGCP